MKKKVLIVEDDKDTLEILAYIAADMNIAYELRSGTVSLSEVKEIEPGLILLDHWISNGFGSEFCRELKQNPETAGIPIVLVSAHPQLAKFAAEGGANGYVAKPFDIDEIQGVIKKYIGE